MRRDLTVIFVLSLCACSGGVPAVSPGQGATSVARWPARSHPDSQKSWFSSELAHTTARLLFVSDSGTADVYIYKLPSLKVMATITGFDQPQGICSDTKGNVWVTDTNGQTVYELTHHGQLENELSDTANPAACAVDPKSGALAVMNLFGGGSTSGAVLVYAKGSGSPKLYQNSSQFYYNFGSYDDSGNLFFDGRSAKGKFMLSELPQGSTSAHTVKISGGTIYFPGMVQWDSSKNELIVGDQSCGNAYTSCLYTMKLTQSGAAINGKIDLQNHSGGPVCDLVQGVEYNGKLAGSDYDFCGSSPSTTYLWPYPAGGSPTAYNDTTDSVPVGATISARGAAGDQGPRSWMSPAAAAASSLLYVSNTNGEVTVYRYSKHTLIGVLTDFTKPMGECSDASGNVYITDSSANKILEYAHGGSKPLKKFDDSPDSPVACSVDPTTGNLAVANYDGTAQAGNVAIWSATSSKRTTYTNSKLKYFKGLAYDNNGNLLVTNGQSSSYSYNYSYFAWLPKGGSTLINIIVPGPKPSYAWRYVGGIQWDSKYFVLDDYAIYRIGLIHGQAYYVGEVDFTNSGSYQFAMYNNRPDGLGTQVVGAVSSDSGSYVDYWNYPSGGSPIYTLTHGIDDPVGLTVSTKK